MYIFPNKIPTFMCSAKKEKKKRENFAFVIAVRIITVSNETKGKAVNR